MKTLRYLFCFFLLAGTLTACDWVSEDADTHTEVEGVRLTLNGATVVTVREAGVTGNLNVRAGQATQTIAVVFLDHDGNPIDMASLEEAFTLGWKVENETVATVQPVGRWGLQLHGHRAGTSTLRVMLMHNNHADFTTPAISIQVAP